ncbi:MAG: TolC family protein [Candidatus Sumerlaeia bacterium]|nr:TolC family protein [Candidatus Sumerlaeia bacterium]
MGFPFWKADVFRRLLLLVPGLFVVGGPLCAQSEEVLEAPLPEFLRPAAVPANDSLNSETIRKLEGIAREGRLPTYEDLRLSEPGTGAALAQIYLQSLPLMQEDDAATSDVVFAELDPTPEFAVLRLEELLTLGFRQNFSLLNSRRSLEIQESGVRTEQGEFVPFVDWVSGARARQSRDFEAISAADRSKETNTTTRGYDLDSGLELTQNLPTGGTVTGDFTEATGESRTTGGNGISETNRYDAGAGVRFTQPLLRGSGLLTGEGTDIGTANLRRARLAQLDAQLQNRLNERDVALRIIRQYFSILQSKQQLVVSRDAILERYRFLDETRVYYEVGRVAESEILRAQIQFLQEVEQAINRQQRLDDAREGLLQVLSLPLETPVSLLDITTQVTNQGAFSIPTVEEALSLARRNRLELLREDLTVEQADIALQLARNNILVDLDFDAGARYFDNGSSFPQANDFKQDTFDAGVSLRVPLSNRIRARESIRSSTLRLDQAKTNRLSRERTIDEEVLQNHRSVLTTEARLTVLRRQVEQARRNLELIRGSYEVGFSSITEVRLAQDDLFNAETSYKTALLDYQVSIAEFYVAVGLPLI